MSERVFSDVVLDLECCRVTLGGSGVFSWRGGIAMLSCLAKLRVTRLGQLGLLEGSGEVERGDKLGSERDLDLASFLVSLGLRGGVCMGEDAGEESPGEESLDELELD